MTALPHEQVSALAREIVAQLEPGIQIRLAKASVESNPPRGGELEVQASLELSVRRGLPVVDQRLQTIQVESRYTVTAVPHSDDEQPPAGNAWKCVAEMHGMWALPDEVAVTDDHLRAFTARVGLMALHPYVRAHMQGAVMETGWPPYSLDVITAQSALFESADDPDLCDLSGIAVLQD